MADTKGQGGQPAEWIPLILALGLLIAFIIVAIWIGSTADEPPRLADPAPSTPPTIAADARDYPPQYRGGYDSNARLLGLIAIISPLLTTVVGFYFGQRAGAAGTRAVQAQAEQEKTQIANLAMKKPEAKAQDFLEELRSRGLVKE